ncbi:hypothetical protein ACH5RR_008741 [Cinchona calisaya]|uniref:NAC domain-containing protein n=1 Tax=Cinchona calisaya TaxID=153742 RepID=A0ABD3ACL5_9GENT
MAPVGLPPRFRFHPTDEELVNYYLKRKIQGKEIVPDIIPEVDLYKCEPWDLAEKSFLPGKDPEWVHHILMEPQCQGMEPGSYCAIEFSMELILHLFGSGEGSPLLDCRSCSSTKQRTPNITLFPGFKGLKVTSMLGRIPSFRWNHAIGQMVQ